MKGLGYQEHHTKRSGNVCCVDSEDSKSNNRKGTGLKQNSESHKQ